MKRTRILTLLFSVMLAFSSAMLIEAALPQTAIVAEAATKKPAQVKGIKVKSTKCGKVKITFKKVSGATGYEIRYSATKNGKFKKIATTEKTSYTYTVGSGKKGYYKVRAYKTSKKKTVYGKYSKIKYIKAKKHNYAGAYYVSKIPTCVKEGKKYQKCSICGKKKYTAIEVDKIDGHNYVIKDATCTKNGKKYCTRCKKVVYKILKTGHAYNTSKVTTKPTCTAEGVRTYYCAKCDATKTAAVSRIAHSYTGKLATYDADKHKVYCSYGCGNYTTANHTIKTQVLKTPTVTETGKLRKYCSCGYNTTVNLVKCSHTGSDIEIRSRTVTCTESGYSGDKYCKVCGAIVEVGKNVAALGHDLSTKSNAKGYLVTTCSRCAYTDTDTTCYIDLTKKTVSVPSVAQFGKTETNGKDCVKLYTDNVSDFEITRGAENFTIMLYASYDVTVKLNGVNITNKAIGTDTAGDNIIGDCIVIKDACERYKTVTGDDGNPTQEKIVPTVSISAKDGTVNTLTVKDSGGNAIQTDAKLELKGHGTINMNTVSTAIDARAKLFIRNLTLDIASSVKRGIDTEYKVPKLDVNGNPILDLQNNPQYKEEYANVEFGANATVTINSEDDGIRCKNMTFNALADETEKGSVVTVTSVSGDGLQLEGKKSLTMYSGTLTLRGSSNNLYDKSGLAPTIVPPAILNK